MTLEAKPVVQTPKEQAEAEAQAAEAERARFKPIPYSAELHRDNPRPVPLFVRRGTDPMHRNESGELDPQDLDVPVLLRGVVAMLAAEGGAGKSMAGLAMAVHVALSGHPGAPVRLWDAWRVHPWQINGENAHPCAVVILGEDSMNETLDRLDSLLRALFETDEQRQAARQYLAGAGGRPPTLHLAAYNGQTRSLAEIGPLLAEYMDATDPDLVVIDPAVRFMSEDAEADNQAGAAFIGQLEALWKRSDDARHHRTTVLVTHHTSKASRGGRSVGTEAARGASALTDNSRAVFTLTPNPNASGFVTLRHTKHNGTARAPQLALTTHGRAVRAESELPADVRDALLTLSTQARARAAAATTLDDARALVNVWDQVKRGDMPESLAVMLTTSDRRTTPKIGGALAHRKSRAASTYRDACTMLGQDADPRIVEGLRDWGGAVGDDGNGKQAPKATRASEPAPMPPPEDE